MANRRGSTRFVPRAPSVAIVAAVPIVVIGVVVPLSLILPRLGCSAPPWIVLAAPAVVLATALMVIGRVMRFTRRIAESDGFLCLNCHYDLHGLPDTGECPECGEAYVRTDLERRWNLWLQSQTKHKHTIRPRSDATVRPESSERNRRGEHGTKT